MGKIIIRDLRQKEKFVLDDAYLNGYARFIGPYGTCVYNSLCRHANKIQKSWPSIKKIAEEHGIGRNSTIKGIKALEFWQIIRKDRIGKTANNRYDLLDKSCWKPISEVYLKEFSEVCQINFRGLRDKLQGFTRRTSNSKETHSKETQKKGISLYQKKLKKAKEKELNTEPYRLAKLLYDLIREQNPAWHVKPNWEQWADDIEKLNRIDGRTWEQIEWMIRWAQNDDFWHKNILSPNKLRKQFNRLCVEAKGKQKKVGFVS